MWLLTLCVVRTAVRIMYNRTYLLLSNTHVMSYYVTLFHTILCRLSTTLSSFMPSSDLLLGSASLTLAVGEPHDHPTNHYNLICSEIRVLLKVKIV